MKLRPIVAATLVIFAATPALTGCAALTPFEFPAYTGPNFENFQPGVTSLREAIVELGAPMSESDMGDGTKLYQWMFDIYRYESKRAVHLAILFDRKNTMVSVSMKTEVPY